MRVAICRRDAQSVEFAIQRLTQAGHRVVASITAGARASEVLACCGAQVFLLDRFMPHPDGHALEKLLSPSKCILIEGDLSAALTELEEYAQESSWTASDAAIHNALLTLGFRQNTRGTRQMQLALRIVLHDERSLQDLKHRVYPFVAQQCRTSVQSVERNLRYAIESVWTRGELDALQRCFGYTIEVERGKPTNKAFLAQIAEHISLRGA